MIESNLAYLQPELMDIIRLFPEAEALEIFHEYTGTQNIFCIRKKEYCYEVQPVRRARSLTTIKSRL